MSQGVSLDVTRSQIKRWIIRWIELAPRDRRTGGCWGWLQDLDRIGSRVACVLVIAAWPSDG